MNSDRSLACPSLSQPPQTGRWCCWGQSSSRPRDFPPPSSSCGWFWCRREGCRFWRSQSANSWRVVGHVGTEANCRWSRASGRILSAPKWREWLWVAGCTLAVKGKRQLENFLQWFDKNRTEGDEKFPKFLELKFMKIPRNLNKTSMKPDETRSSAQQNFIRISLQTHQSMRISSAKLLKHVHDLIARLYRFEILRLQVIFFDAFDAKSEICGARDCLAPHLKSIFRRLFNYAMSFCGRGVDLTM